MHTKTGERTVTTAHIIGSSPLINPAAISDYMKTEKQAESVQKGATDRDNASYDLN